MAKKKETEEERRKRIERVQAGRLNERDRLELAQSRAKQRGMTAVKTPEGFEELTLEQAELTPSVAEQMRLSKLDLQKKETAKKLAEGAEKPLEKPLETEGETEEEKLSKLEIAKNLVFGDMATDPLTGKPRIDPETGEQVRIAQGTLPIMSGAGQFGAGVKAGGNVIRTARASLSKLNKWEGFKLFGFSIKLKEIVAGAAIFSQDIVRRLIRNINSDATKLGTERNEKIARWMISGLHPDKAIELYQQDRDYLIAGQESVQLYRVFYLWDYLAGDVDTTMLNIQNQIDAKDSRIAEALKFKEGITTAEIQNMIMETEEGEVENVV